MSTGPTGHTHNWRVMGPGPRALYGCVECGLEGNRAMWARMEALEARIAEAQEQMTMARQIMEAVAAKTAALDNFDNCVFCGEQQWDGTPEDHEPKCPVTLARAWLGEGKDTG